MNTAELSNLVNYVFHNRGLGLALVGRPHPAADTLSLLTPVPAEKIRVVQVGDLYLRADGRELGRV